MKGIISLLLILTITASLGVPYAVTASAADEPARGDEICALLYKIDPSKNNTRNLELVFQRGDTPDPERADALIKTYRNFADTDCGLNPPWKLDYSSNTTSIYKGTNTTGETREVDKDYRFITNINCTSKQGQGTTNNNSGVVLYDHCNYETYRLYTLVVTCDDADSASHKGDKLAARAYIRYYDANGMLRVFYNTYKKSMYSGCMCSFNQAYAAIYG